MLGGAPFFLGSGLASGGQNVFSNSGTPITFNNASGSTTAMGALYANTSAGAVFGHSYWDGTDYLAFRTVASHIACGSVITFFVNSGTTAGVAFTPTERMRLSTTGLGIGMTPTRALDVTGAIGCTTTLNVGTTSTFTGVSTHTAGASMGARLDLKSYTFATLPAVGVAGGLVYCSNATGGAVVVFSNGTNWLRCDTSAIVS